jgi:phospholipase/carboxylesterase
MGEKEQSALVSVLRPLLTCLEALGFVARYFHPGRLAAVLEAAGAPDADLTAARAALRDWPAPLAPVGKALDDAADAVLDAFAELRAAGDDELVGVHKALRHVPRSLEALYPLCAVLGPINRFFLDPLFPHDPEDEAGLASAMGREDAGVMSFGKDRGGLWLYVPETIRAEAPAPLVMALHGGGGSGRRFLWSWLREARSRGALLVAPSALVHTWAISGPDADSPNLERILDFIRSSWPVDPQRLLLTGMSDGGTFTYRSGLAAGSPFTHLAPVSAAFHPILAHGADPRRVQGLPVHIVHGGFDWLFPPELARRARQALEQAGARVSYREIEDLSHCYPREMNGPLLEWLADT